MFSMFFSRRKTNARIATRLAAIRINSRGLSRCGGIRRTVSVPVLTMAQLVGAGS
jgi:hypothetical protein